MIKQFQTGLELEVEEQTSLLDWFANNYKNFGTNLQIITDKSQEGSQFVKGFGGIGGNINKDQTFKTIGNKINTKQIKVY